MNCTKCPFNSIQIFDKISYTFTVQNTIFWLSDFSSFRPLLRQVLLAWLKAVDAKHDLRRLFSLQCFIFRHKQNLAFAQFSHNQKVAHISIGHFFQIKLCVMFSSAWNIEWKIAFQCFFKNVAHYNPNPSICSCEITTREAFKSIVFFCMMIILCRLFIRHNYQMVMTTSLTRMFTKTARSQTLPLSFELAK